MNTLARICRKFVADERGLETVEYAIITGLIVAGTIGIIGAIGAWVYNTFEGVRVELNAPRPT